MPVNARNIAIVGLGPRGLSVLERIAENANSDPGSPAILHVIDSHEPGGGGVWQPGQSRHLLMNTVASQVTMFTDESVSCRGTIVPGPSLHEWLCQTDPTMRRRLLGPEMDSEASGLGPDDYPSRALYGKYLKWVFGYVRERMPSHVSVRVYKSRVSRLTLMPSGRISLQLVNSAERLIVDRAVLALGHLPGEIGNEERGLMDFAADHGLRYLAPANPADMDTSSIPAGETVILRGLGLNFFDYMTLLTRGRGGEFRRNGNGELTYAPSGQEPRLYAGSRRGIPYQARGSNQKGVTGRHQPRFLTPEKIASLQRQAKSRCGISFREQIWPLVTREVEFVYYSTLLRRRGDHSAADLLEKELASPSVSPAGPDVDLDTYGISAADRWSWNRVTRPWGDRTWTAVQDFSDWLVQYLRDDVSCSRRGNVQDPLKAALDAMRDLRNEVRQVIDHGQLTPDSYRDDINGFYTSLNAFVSIGPPAHRIEEMIALIKADVLTVAGLGFQVACSRDGQFQGWSPSVPGSTRSARALIEARLPEAGIATSDDPLIRSLIDAGIARSHTLGASRTSYDTGGLDVTDKPYHVIDRNGSPNPNLHAFGVPTEGVHWATAAGIRPGVDSVILGDADAIARTLLGLAAEPSHP